jgi:outer membrane protein assembly factor BamB
MSNSLYHIREETPRRPEYDKMEVSVALLHPLFCCGSSAMRIDELIFVGLRGYVIALHRDTGEIVWNCSELKSGPITLLLDGDRLIASTNGYIYCLDPLTGQVLWNNPLKGYGVGVTHLVSVRGQSDQTMNQQAVAAEAAANASSTGIVAANPGVYGS